MFDFETIWPYLLGVVVIGIVFYFVTKQPEFNPPPQLQKITKDLTLQQLKQYDGQKKPQIFLAAKGVIYDVTNAKFYQKDGPYGVFAGHDASINLSKMSHDQNLLNKWGSYKMTQDQQGILNDWVKTFQGKYRRVGLVK